MNWQHCANVAFVGLSDSYEAFYQAVRRCYRFGQVRTVNCHVITSELEGAVVKNIERKEKQAREMSDEIVKHTASACRDNIHGQTRDVIAYKENVKTGDGWECWLGDSCELLKGKSDASVDYIIYSPPFSSLYTYSNSDRDIGNVRNYEEFAEHYKFMLPELYRLLKPGRLLSFHCMDLPLTKERDGVIGLRDFRGELIRMHQEAGFILHSQVVIWKDPVTAMQRTKAIGLLYKQLRKDSAMSRQGIPDYLVTMRKPGVNPDPVTKTHESFPVSLWQRYASPVWMDIDASDTLQRESAREQADERHIAPLQLGVIRRAIELWTNPHDIVLSPFGGIGSEGYVAVQMGRRAILCELKESYWEQAWRNLKRAEASHEQNTLFAQETDSEPTA
jgi:DNA modification methylase